jgi:hypothetical protein
MDSRKVKTKPNRTRFKPDGPVYHCRPGSASVQARIAGRSLPGSCVSVSLRFPLADHGRGGVWVGRGNSLLRGPEVGVPMRK